MSDLTVLIIEDDELLREVYATKFELEGFRVEQAEDGEIGLEKATRLKPDIILIDNLMPRRTGIEVLEAYHKVEGSDRSHILMLSNKSSRDDRERARKLGATEYLLKSQFTPRDIVLKIKEHLANA